MNAELRLSWNKIRCQLLLAGVLLAAAPMLTSNRALAQSTPDSREDKDDTDASKQYQAPDISAKFFEADSVVLATLHRKKLLQLLTALAVNEKSSMLVKARTLGIALRIDPVYRPAFSANLLLKQNRVPEPQSDPPPELDTVVSDLFELASFIKIQESDTDDNLILAMHVMDIVKTMDPANVDCAYELELLAKNGKEINWQPVTGGVDEAGPKANTVIGGMSSGSGSGLARMQTLIKGLLVRPLEASQFAGKASQMNATATTVKTGKELKVAFNQEVGSSMESALGEVIKYLRIRHEQLPSDCEVEIAFEEQYIPKDGPSAAVACALMLESLITDTDLDARFAVTGDLNADGTVQPVGGITGKLRGAAARDCNVVGIPHANRRIISDMLIISGPKALAKIQIFSLKTFDEALVLAQQHDARSEEIRRSIEEFDRVLEVLNRPNGMRMLKNSHVQGKLRECLKLTPNHLSARHLLLAALGRTEKHLSLQGSLEYIDRAAGPLLRVMRQGDFQHRSAFDEDEFADAAAALRQIRTRLDPRTTEISDRIVDFSKLVRTFTNNRPTSSNGLRDLIGKIGSAGDAVGSAYDKLESSVDYQEEVMK